ncbi:TIGR04076 family protein [Campylobacter upsaliensis]
MYKVKIEVIKTHFDENLAKEFGVDSVCPMHKVGESFISLGFDKPQGFCDEAWKAIYQYVFALAHNDRENVFYFKDWIKKPGIAINSCNDEIRPVIFKLTRLVSKAQIDDFYKE